MDDRVADVLQRVAAEHLSPGTRHRAPALQRLCQVAVRSVPATGASVSVVATDGVPHLVAASAGVVPAVDGLDQVTGGGPGTEAFVTGHRVLVPDLDRVEPGRWPGYAAAAGESGIRAAFALPLEAGGVRLGALELYRAEPGELAGDERDRALSCAAAALSLLLAGPPADESGSDLPYRPEIFQAQGMVMMQLGIPPAEAVVRLRAHAYAHGRQLGEVAGDVVARRLVLEPLDRVRRSAPLTAWSGPGGQPVCGPVCGPMCG